ncbi:MAG: alpha/beta hydrolase [Leptospiraceae bacterium]|nr:alpha/beta hydrolase [Leptospiraceae bacterium]
MQNRSILGTLLSSAAALAGLGAAAAGAVAGWTIHSIHQKKRKDLLDDYFITPFELDIPHEEVRFITRDRVVLKGWWFACDGSDKTVVAMTGRHGRKDDLIGIGTGLWKRKYNVLVFDYRGRGESEEATASIGHFEKADAEAALDYAMQRVVQREGSCRPALLGYSMGAVLALHLAALRPEVETVVADCPFASLDELVRNKLKERYIPSDYLMPFIDYLNRAIYGYSLQEVSPLRWIHRIAPRPIMLIHAERDRIIPVEDTLRLFEAAGEPKELWIESDVDHCGAYFKDREAYIQRVGDYMDDVFAGKFFQ